MDILNATILENVHLNKTPRLHHYSMRNVPKSFNTYPEECRPARVAHVPCSHLQCNARDPDDIFYIKNTYVHTKRVNECIKSAVL